MLKPVGKDRGAALHFLSFSLITEIKRETQRSRTRAEAHSGHKAVTCRVSEADRSLQVLVLYSAGDKKPARPRSLIHHRREERMKGRTDAAAPEPG